MALPVRPEVYAGQHAVLATKHGKENAMAQLFKMQLRLQLVVPEYLDTDRLGTFTCEVPRAGSLQEAVLRKARLGMEVTGLRVGLASEGEYALDPANPARSIGTEMLAFVDEERNLQLVEELEVDDSNYRVAEVTGIDALRPLLAEVRFPSHALTVRPNQGDLATMVFKGLRNERVLAMAIEYCCKYSADGLARVESDMRAHCNPTRMDLLQKLAERLITRLTRGTVAERATAGA